MDQSKWSLPRHREVQSSREASVLQRPRIKLQGVWLRGVCLHLFAVHPGIPSDPSLVCECLLRAIEMAHDVFKKEGRKFPDSLMCWVPCLHPVNNFALSSDFYQRIAASCFSKADNTVRENKNNSTVKLFTSLLQKGCFRSGALLFPRVGHSHGQLGRSSINKRSLNRNSNEMQRIKCFALIRL